jgi:hypothetical protein
MTKQIKPQKRGRPHNAKTGHEFESLHELVNKLGAEKKLANRDGEVVEMAWAERSFRAMVDRALAGNRRDLAQLLRHMIEHPRVSNRRATRAQYFVRGALAHVL